MSKFETHFPWTIFWLVFDRGKFLLFSYSLFTKSWTHLFFPCSFLGVESRLLKARMKMQQKYLDQFYMLYDDFHITKLPLLPEEVYDIYIATLLLIIASYWWSCAVNNWYCHTGYWGWSSEIIFGQFYIAIWTFHNPMHTRRTGAESYKTKRTAQCYWSRTREGP